MAAAVRQLSVNLYFLRRVKEKYRPVQSLSGSFPLWEETEALQIRRTKCNTYFLKVPASQLTLSKENYSQNNKCHAVVS